MQKIAIILGLAIVASALAGCATTSTTTKPTSTTPLSTTPGSLAPVTDAWYNATQTPPGPNTTYAFDGPASLNPGWITFHLGNKGLEPHQLVVVKLAAGETFAQHQEMMMHAAPSNGTMGNGTMDMGGAMAYKDTYVGGIGNVLPGATANATVHLTPGTYVIECQIPGMAGPHFMHGMLKELTVAGADNGATEPTGDLTLALFDYGFAWSTAPTAGHHRIKVVNNGTLDHEAPMERLVGNATILDFLNWSANPTTAPPVDESLGAGGISPGQVQYVDATFAPGRTYGVACFFFDEHGAFHFMRGMVAQWST